MIILIIFALFLLFPWVSQSNLSGRETSGKEYVIFADIFNKMEKKMNAITLKNSFKNSIWLLYILIVFEILYMISPFAMYYYSIYSSPLNFLQSNHYTAFLTLHFLPHFTHHNSIYITVLNYICWPLMILGLITFLLCFSQIYYAKFAGKGVVSGGIYNYVRHPQYAALALLGLGTTIYWPRFIVFIMYATMLFLYYFLARQEERICISKFGKPYEEYMARTGMFFPKIFNGKVNIIQKINFKSYKMKIFFFSALYFIYIAIIIMIGFGLRHYSITNINAVFTDNKVIVPIAKIEEEKIYYVLDIIKREINSKIKFNENEKQLIYILPSEWSIPELGIMPNVLSQNYIANSETHGNPNNYDPDKLTALITIPVLLNGNETGEEILFHTLSFIPKLEVSINIPQNKIISINERKDRGKWEGVPVPVF